MGIHSYNRDGKTYYEVFVKVRDRNGKQFSRRQRGIASKKHAKSIEFQLKKELDIKLDKICYWNFEGWHSECLRQMKLTMKMSTVSTYDGDTRRWLPEWWNQMELKDITKADVHRLIFEGLGEKANQHTRKRIFKRIKRLLEMAVEEGLIPRNPSVGIKVSVPVRDKKVLNSVEAETLLKMAKECQHRFYHVWAFALFTGMRSGEMYALRWNDIDFETNLISINKQWTSKDGLHTTKSNRNRVVPISPELKSLLQELRFLGAHSDKFLIYGGSSTEEKEFDDLVLPRVREWRYGEQARVLAEFCESIGITKVRFHDLRATFITNLLAQGVPLVKVMSLVGHSKMSTTDEYLRLAGVDIEGATDRLGYQMPKGEGSKVINLFQD